MLPSSDLAHLLDSMRTIFRALALLFEILFWYAFGRWVYRKNHPRERWFPDDL
jgi:hypothetical protein